MGVLPLGSSTATAHAAAATTPPTPTVLPVPSAPVHSPAAIEALADYQPAVSCDETAKSGVVKFAALIERTYASTGSSGLVNPCSAEGSVSEHTEGRAWDWSVHVDNPVQVA